MRASFFLLALLAACRGGSASAPSSGSAVADLDVGNQHAAPVAIDAAVAAKPVESPKPVEPAPTPVPGKDFADDAKLLFRVAACGNASSPVPDVLGGGDPKTLEAVAKIVERHCK